ncbi:MAG: hypothetical protein ACM3L6_07410 [Deltaproteobacteria bacterium]
MSASWIRVAQEHDLETVKKHLIVVGELTGECQSCRHVGIDYGRERYCPECKTDFRYIASRKSAKENNTAVLARLAQRRPDLVYVEYQDIKNLDDRQKARDIFKI